MAFQDLLVWQKAHAVALEVYRHTASFPVEERFGLTSQMRRCAVSIPSNIAEGSGRNGDVEFARFMDVALGSANELEYQLLLCRDLELLTSEVYGSLESSLAEVKRLAVSFRNRLRQPHPASS